VTDPENAAANAAATLAAVARRLDAAAHLEPAGGAAVLQSIVDATVTLFDAEAASLALHDPVTDGLVFRVAAGEHGQGVIGVTVAPGEGVAGYVQATGRPLAIADVAADPRFERAAAERTGYVPRTLLAVPLVDETGVLGVLEILDRRDGGSFGLRDIELASVFARQASVAIRATGLERGAAQLLRDALVAITAADASGLADGDIDALVSAATPAGGEDDAVWRIADRIARLDDPDPADVRFIVEILDALDRRTAARRPRRPISG
jgi:GAF domain-containing protein